MNAPRIETVRTDPDSLLSRDLGVRELATTIFNYTVGSGIFALPAFAVLKLGTAAPLAYLACAVLIGLVVLCFAEAGSRVSMTGGAYAYVETALGPFIGFIGGTLLFVSTLSAGAAVATIFAGGVVSLIPDAPAWLAKLFIVVIIAAMVFINIRGVRSSARMIEVITIAKLVPLLGFVIIGIAFVDTSHLKIANLPPMASILSTAGVVIFAFCGIESALVPSGEVRAPSRTVPRAAFIALGAATLLYLAIQWVALGILGLELAKEPVTPLARAAAVFGGPTARSVMIVGATISMFGYLSANVLAAPRCLFAFGRDRFIPGWFCSVHPRYHTPHVAIIAYGVIVIALALSGTFEALAIFSNLAALVLYFLCAIALWKLRKRDVRTDGEPFIAPGGILLPITTCAMIAWLFYETTGPKELIGLGIAVVIAIVLYAIRRQRLSTPA